MWQVGVKAPARGRLRRGRGRGSAKDREQCCGQRAHARPRARVTHRGTAYRARRQKRPKWIRRRRSHVSRGPRAGRSRPTHLLSGSQLRRLDLRVRVALVQGHIGELGALERVSGVGHRVLAERKYRVEWTNGRPIFRRRPTAHSTTGAALRPPMASSTTSFKVRWRRSPRVRARGPPTRGTARLGVPQRTGRPSADPVDESAWPLTRTGASWCSWARRRWAKRHSCCALSTGRSARRRSPPSAPSS